MAGKKAQARLTPEEKLQQALVPEAEQPYKVPTNWCWTFIRYVSHVVTGGTPSKKHTEYYGGNFPFFKPVDLNSGRHVYNASEYLSEAGKNISCMIPKYSTLVCCIGSIGKSGYLEIDGTTNQQINSAIPKFDSLYLYYFINTNYFIIQLLQKASATTISIVNKTKMENCFFPLPPLAEQQRIVERIESLFAKLDEAKEKLQNVLDGFETRKAAILHKAFTGELTANWRKQHGISMDSWEEKKLGKIVKNIKDKYEPMLNNKKCIKYIGLEHIEKNNGIIGFGSSDDVKSLKTIFELGDILYGKLRPYLNKHDIAKFSGICSTDILVYRAEDFNTAKFMNYFMNTEKFIFYTVSNSKGINLPRISEKEVSGILVNVPTLSEQSEIVRIIDDLLAKEQQAKELAENAITKIDIIKKSILARAFRGELGTNNPADESAVELLKRVL